VIGVNLSFNYGALLPDPKGRLDGKGTRIRHIKIENAGELRATEVAELISKTKAFAIVKAIYPQKRRPVTER
jgi:hypothetical protein